MQARTPNISGSRFTWHPLSSSPMGTASSSSKGSGWNLQLPCPSPKQLKTNTDPTDGEPRDAPHQLTSSVSRRGISIEPRDMMANGCAAAPATGEIASAPSHHTPPASRPSCRLTNSPHHRRPPRRRCRILTSEACAEGDAEQGDAQEEEEREPGRSDGQVLIFSHVLLLRWAAVDERDP